MGRAPGADDIENQRWRYPDVSTAIITALGPHQLTDAACHNQFPRWDLDVTGETPDERRDRHTAAVAICRWSCPALPRCERLVDALPAGASGVWAGRVLDGRPLRQNLPRFF